MINLVAVVFWALVVLLVVLVLAQLFRRGRR